MRSLLLSMLAACAVANSLPEPVASPDVIHEFGRRWTQEEMYNTSTSTECSAVHIIVDRATGEPPSQGVIGTLATLIASRMPGTTVEWVDYPAVLMPYDQSTDTGIRMTKDAIRSYADRCSSAKIVMLGYSQGAQVVGDVLCGGGGAFGLGPVTEPLEETYFRRIAAAVQMGDPRFMPNEVWNFGTGTFMTGVFPRQPPQSCDRAAALLRSYCDIGDPYCAVPGLDQDKHASYNLRYNDDAFNFVQGKVNGSTAGKSGDGARQSPRSSAPLALTMLLVLAAFMWQ